MKLAVVGDVHICRTASLVTRDGFKYSKRLENCINTLNWVEHTAAANNCDGMVYLGDVFDRPEINDEIITAVREIEWNRLPKYFIVGNHESSVSSLKYSAVKIFENLSNIIVDQPYEETIGNTVIQMLPYVVESDRQALSSYFTKNPEKKHILLMHNDIAGLDLGPLVTKVGFSIDEILANSDLCIDGHLHNGIWIVPNRLRTLGNITGLNLGEDAENYKHCMTILNTDTLSCTDIENPYAFNFYKKEINSEQDLRQLVYLKNNAVVSLKCPENLVVQTRTFIEQYCPHITEYRIIVNRDFSASEATADLVDLSVDHIQKFMEYCQSRLDNTELLQQELIEICK